LWYRFVQPPQVAYFVNTIDKNGNVNTTPTTLGTCVSVDMEPDAYGNFYFTFSLGYKDLPIAAKRQSVQNLEEVPECVISFIGHHLVWEAQIACTPIPKGICEIDVAGLTRLPSTKVAPPGIKECGVNLECKIIHTHDLGQYYRHYICQVVGASVSEDLLEKNAKNWPHAGMYELDPVFEINVLYKKGKDGENVNPPRLYFIRLDHDSIERMPDEIGPSREWVGSFENWMKDEVARGSLSEEDKDRIIALNNQWQKDRSRATNGAVQEELTDMLGRLLRRKNG
jgi:flavin reductase (DIM6/NTAB) family NADH-FMN oxidoreductase RutF